MGANLVGLEIELGLQDKGPTPWGGDIHPSEGRVVSIEVLRGGPNARASGNHFTCHSVRRMVQQKPVFLGPILHVNLDAELSAKVTVNSAQGKFEFALSDLTMGTAKHFLGGQVSVNRENAAMRLTEPDMEDDYPTMAKGQDGAVWLAYVAYQPGPPIIPERLQAQNFETLVPKGNGDQIRLMRWDGRAWQPPLDVTEPGLDVWRPTATVDGKGDVWIAWSQQVDGDWEIFYRRYTPATSQQPQGQWSEIVRLTRSPGSDIFVAATTDSQGVVWLAWQAWRKDNFDIMLAALSDGHPWKEPRVLSTSPANDWSPAIAADKLGNVYVAWDTYDKGNYDVILAVVGKEPMVMTVAGSAHFEARPSIVCDDKNRLWIAYEEGDEQWGKDYCGDHYRRIPLPKNPGAALYIHRTVKVKCLANGKLMQPADDLEQVLKAKLPRNRSLPRLCLDTTGGLWLLVRHHAKPGAAGENWSSYALRYDGRHWSFPQPLSNSSNVMDVRPALVPHGQGILAVYSGDDRTAGTLSRKQADLFACMLQPTGPAHVPELVADAETREAVVPVVHPDEAKDVARMRGTVIEAEGNKLRLLRGEFHRHTEYSSHQDQDGSLEDAWRYALDPAALDWIGIGDHDNGYGHEYPWWQMQKITDLFQNAPQFVAVHTYERSVVYPNGHRNVIMPHRGIRPLPRGILKGTPEGGTPDTKQLYAYLKFFGGICASHTSATNMGTDWRDNDPEVEPIVEIYQGHRHNYEHAGAPRAPTAATQVGGYEPAGYVWNALEKGYRLGFEASSDHISTHISYAVLLTQDVSRQGIIDAFKKRHSYGATDNILLDVRSGRYIMGDQFDTAKRPELDIHVQGTAPIAKLHVIRDNKYVYSAEPKEREVNLKYVDMEAKPGKTSYYYVCLEQQDGNLDDHFANRCAAAIALGKTGRLRQAGSSPPSRGKDVRHAKPICAADCTGPRYAKSLAGSYPSPLHAAGSGVSLPDHLSARSQRSAVQSSSCQRVRLRSQHRRSVAHTLSPARSRWSARCSSLRSATELFPPTNSSKSSRWPPAKRASMIASPVNGASTTSPPSWSTATPTKR